MKLTSTLVTALIVLSSSSSAFAKAKDDVPNSVENKVLIGEDGNHSMMPYSPPPNTNTDPHQSRRELYHRILKNVDNKGQSKKEVRVPKPNQSKIDAIKNQQDSVGTPLKVGVSEEIPLIPIAIAEDSSVVSTTCVQSDGADGLKLHISELDIPNGIEVYVTCQDEEDEVAYDIKPDESEWTYTCNGDTACVNIMPTEEATGLEEGHVIGYVSEMGYMVNGESWGTRRRLGIQGGEDERELFGCGSPRCYQDACNAQGIPAGLYPEAIAGIMYDKNGYWYSCSGALIANTNKKMYFITANHCVGEEAVAKTIEAWGDGVSNCDHGRRGCPGRFHSNGFHSWKTNGATMVKTLATTDFTMVELSGNAHPSMKWLGWTTESVPSGFILHRLSHPQGYHMSYSTHEVQGSLTYGCGSFNPSDNFWNTNRDTGDTSGGSSGSAVTNGKGQVVGQLLGVCGRYDCRECSNSDCQVRRVICCVFIV